MISVSEVRWLSTEWGGLSRLSGRWVKSLDVHPVERWVHTSKLWVIQEERLPVKGADGERTCWSLFSFSNGRLVHKLLESDDTSDVPSDGYWHRWKVRVNYHVLSPPTWGEIYGRKSPYMLPTDSPCYKDEVSFHVSKADTLYGWYSEVQEIPLLIAWDFAETTCLPSRVPAGSWSMRANTRDEDNMGFCRDLVPAPSIECTAGSGGRISYEECERHFDETQKRDIRAQGLGASGAVKVRVNDLRAGDHIFYPTLTGAVYHHAIVTSNENGCRIGNHFNQGVASVGGVKEVSLLDDPRFKSCDTVYCVNRSDYYCGYGPYGGMVRRDGDGKHPLERKPDEIVRTAKESLVTADEHGFEAIDYMGVLNNCEHFCTYCCTGKRYCYQFWSAAEDGTKAIGGVAVGGALAGAIALTAAPVALSFAVPIAAASSASVVAASMWRRWDRLFNGQAMCLRQMAVAQPPIHRLST